MSDRVRSILASASVLLILAIKLATSFLPSARLWGVNQLAYFSPVFRIVFFGVVLLIIAVCAFAHRLSVVRRLCEAVSGNVAKWPKALTVGVTATVLLALFYIFADSTSLLGDGMLRIGELGRGKPIPATEPLEFLIHNLSYVHILRPLGLSYYEVYPLWSYIAGLLFFPGLWLFAKDLKGQGIDPFFTFVYLSGWGGVMFFFGYVENYSLTAAVLLFFFVSANRYLKNGDNLVVLVGLFLLGFFLHNLLAIFLPALVYALLMQCRHKKVKTTLSLVVIFATVVSWMLLSYGGAEVGAFLLPDSPSEPGYLLWSRAHVVDIVNELFLVSPAFFVVVWLIKRHHGGPSQRRQFFFWLAALCSLGVLLFFDPKLGMARDWDLFALLLLSFHLALYLSVDWTRVGRFVKTAIAVISLTFTLLWVLSNSGEAQSLARYNVIVKLDQERARYGYERLGVFHMLRGRWQEAEAAYTWCLQRKAHPKSYLGLGIVQMRQGKYQEALQSLKTARKLDPKSLLADRYLGEVYFKLGRYEEARKHLDRFLKLNPGAPDTAAEELFHRIQLRLEKQKEKHPRDLR